MVKYFRFYSTASNPILLGNILSANLFAVQNSYVFNNGWAVDGRYASVMPEFDVVNSNIRTQQWYTFGVNKFMKNNAAKIGLNINYMENVTPLITTKKIAANLAVQILL
mgnify:CR=1 FL=1